jgi:hypothetical protein
MAEPPVQTLVPLPKGFVLPTGITETPDGQFVNQQGQVVRNIPGLNIDPSSGQLVNTPPPGQSSGQTTPPPVGLGTNTSSAQGSALQTLTGQSSAGNANLDQYGNPVYNTALTGVGGYQPGPLIQGPNAVAYADQVAQADKYANQYGQDANQALNRAAPKIAGLGQFNSQMGQEEKNYGNMANTYGQIASGQGPAGHLAENQFNQALGQSIDSNTALARSATGGAIGQAGAERAALEGNAATTAGAAGTSAINQGQMQLSALAAQQGAYNSQQGADQSSLAANQAQSNLQMSQNQANYGLASNLYGQQNQSQQGALAATNAYTAASNQSQALQLNSDVANANADLGTATALGNAFGFSDARAKDYAGKEDDPGYAPDLADEFLKSLDPKHFRYKDPSLEPSPNPHGGDYLGIFAQDMEKAPEIGKQLISNDPRTGLKRVNIAAAVGATLAGLGRLNERLSELENGKKKVGLMSDEDIKIAMPDLGDDDQALGGQTFSGSGGPSDEGSVTGPSAPTGMSSGYFDGSGNSIDSSMLGYQPPLPVTEGSMTNGPPTAPITSMDNAAPRPLGWGNTGSTVGSATSAGTNTSTPLAPGPSAAPGTSPKTFSQRFSDNIAAKFGQPKSNLAPTLPGGVPPSAASGGGGGAGDSYAGVGSQATSELTGNLGTTGVTPVAPQQGMMGGIMQAAESAAVTGAIAMV